MLHFALPEDRKNAAGGRVGLSPTAALILSLLLAASPLHAAGEQKSDQAQPPAAAEKKVGETGQAPQQQPAADQAQPPAAAEKKAGETEQAPQQKSAAENVVLKVGAQRADKKLELIVSCAKPPVHTAYELPGRKGIVVDVAASSAPKPEDMNLPESFKIGLSAKVVAAAVPATVRLEFTLPRLSSKHVDSVKGNDIVVSVEDFFADDAPAAATVPEKGEAALPAKEGAAAQKEQGGPAQKDSIDSQLPLVDPLKNVASIGSAGAPAAEQAGSHSFKATGYDDSKLITVDFFKVDIHNVFRLLREVSGVNIIVSEGVSGTLTLALNEVPWDFALDIIVNLKDLAKEQRHNTIVIWPKDKEFVWPEKEAEIIIDEAEPGNKGGKAQGAIVIGQGGEELLSPEVNEAKKLSAQGIRAEKEGNLETAVQLYEKALNDWPESKAADREEKSRLANKIASIYLGQLDQSAKAVYFAKKALAVDKKNSSAALNAAIGHANMEESSLAQQYFDQSVSIGTPSREALLNYAVFSEQQRQYDAALRLLGKYNELYGENLDSMVARARIFDQQGRREDADKAYMAILHAGFQVPPDLREFIANRISRKSN